MLCSSFDVIRIIDFRKLDVLGTLRDNDNYFSDSTNCASFISYSDQFITGSGTGCILEGELAFSKIKIKNVTKVNDGTRGILQIIPSCFYDGSFICVDKGGEASVW